MSFTIRPATLANNDQNLLIDFQDSQLAHLASIGSAEQWGTTPIRIKNPNIIDKTTAWITASEFQTKFSSEDWCRVFIAETLTSTAVGGLVLERKAREYVPANLLPSDFVSISYLITNREAGDVARGAGAVLIEKAKEVAKEVGVATLLLDCWRGNGGGLVQYYERQGFAVVGEFDVPREKMSDWEGAVLEMKL